MTFKHLFLLACLVSSGTPAAAQMLSARDPQAIAAFMRERGFPAELELAAQGSAGPQIASAAGGTHFTLLFRNCSAGANCTTVSFFTGFADVDASLERINGWNAANRFARAYIDDEQDPVLIMDVDMDRGGITRENFADYLAIWNDLAPRFLKYLRAGVE